MSATYMKVYGATKKEAEDKARAEIKKLDFMRQPSLHSLQPDTPGDLEGRWIAVIKYWGLD